MSYLIYMKIYLRNYLILLSIENKYSQRHCLRKFSRFAQREIYNLIPSNFLNPLNATSLLQYSYAVIFQKFQRKMLVTILITNYEKDLFITKNLSFQFYQFQHSKNWDKQIFAVSRNYKTRNVMKDREVVVCNLKQVALHFICSKLIQCAKLFLKTADKSEINNLINSSTTLSHFPVIQLSVFSKYK